MIDNIKRFVNEHHTLMVVIIGVLVICFLYWWFCCKDRPLANKVKGGIAGFKITKINGNYYKIVGVPLTGECLIVLSKEAENLLENLNKIINRFYLYFDEYTRTYDINDIENRYNIIKVIKEPCTYFNLNTGITKNTGLALFGSQNITTFINTTEDFDFSSIINQLIQKVNVKDEIKNQKRKKNLMLVLTRYNELVEFVKTYAQVYFDEATFIGQPSVYPYTGDDDEKDDSLSYRFSIVSQITMNNKLYDDCNKEVRSWYSSESVNKAISNGYYLIPENGDIKYVNLINFDKNRLQDIDISIDKNNSLDCGVEAVSDLEDANEQDIQPTPELETEKVRRSPRNHKAVSYIGMFSDENVKTKNKKKNKVGWQVADIYPANKVISTVLFLLGLLEKYIDVKKTDNEHRKNRNVLKFEYFQMMSSYMIYVHLLNICCGVRMTSRWNIKISNAYVYKFIDKKSNVQGETISTVDDLFMEKSLKKETGHQIAEMTKHFMGDEYFMQGFMETLGDNYMREIINSYTFEYLNGIDAKNAITNADAILDVVRNLILIEDADFGFFMERISNNTNTKFLHDVCAEIVNQRLQTNMRLSQPLEYSNITINLDSINEIEDLKKIQIDIIKFIDNDNDNEENFQNIVQSISIINNKYEFEDILISLNNISLYHFRTKDFMNKIEKIILIFKDKITEYFSNYELFKIFLNNFRIILFLYQLKIFSFEHELIFSWYANKRSIDYFIPELKLIDSSKNYKQINNYEEYDSKRKIGENDTPICECIRHDSVDKFMTYIENGQITSNSYIPYSCFETNQMLIENGQISLIQYAAFFGSVNIFMCLIENGAKFDVSILKFVVHGRNSKIFKKIKEKMNKPEFDILLLPAIQCFEFDYIKHIFEDYDNSSEIKSFYLKLSLKYRNYNIWENITLNDIELILPQYSCYLITEHIFKIYNNININTFWSNSLTYSCYDFIKLVKNQYDKKLIDNVDNLENIKKIIEDGKAAPNVKVKISFFMNAYLLKIDTNEKYNKLYNTTGLNDEFTKFIEICEGKKYIPYKELLNAFTEEEEEEEETTFAPPTPEQIDEMRKIYPNIDRFINK